VRAGSPFIDGGLEERYTNVGQVITVVALSRIGGVYKLRSMDTRPRASPPTLDYVGPPQIKPDADWEAGMLLLGTACFAIGFWITEYLTGYVMNFVFFIRGVPSSPYGLIKLHDTFYWDMCIETAFCLAAAVLVLIIQCIYDPRRDSPLRHNAWLIAALLGLGNSWARWGIWWLVRLSAMHYSDGADFMIAMSLAAGTGLLIARWRRRPLVTSE
jgi:hypothetical protein